MVNAILTRNEKEAIKRFKYHVNDQSVVTEYMSPFWNWLVTLVPNTVAPNILSVAGMLCLIYTFHLCYHYINSHPVLVPLASALLIFTYMNLDSIDGKHARNTGNASPLGEIVDHSCDNIGTPFLMLTMCYVLGINNSLNQWYIVQTAQLIFLFSHIQAYKEKVVTFGKWTGPCEFLTICILTCTIASFFSFNQISIFIASCVRYLGFDSKYMFNLIVASIYYVVFFGVSAYTVTVNSYATRNGLLISLFARFIPSIFIYLSGFNHTMDLYTVISHGLIMAVLTGDMIVSKMANSDMHPIVPVLIILSLFDNFFCVTLALGYYVIVISELAFYLRLPVLSVHTNVYCSGVFDMLHVNHMKMFEQSASFGTRLIVGVHNDADVESYKRKPTMSQIERVETVGRCKYVDEIIPDAPLNLTREFIEKHKIHVVVCSDEYDKPDDVYYKVPRDIGILQIIPRNQGMSTSELMNRMKKKE